MTEVTADDREEHICGLIEEHYSDIDKWACEIQKELFKTLKRG
jgi:hypothetical protein